MKLEKYVRKNYKSVAEAARNFGISRQYLYELFNKTSTPRVSTARRISKITGGVVTETELMGIN